MEDSSEDKSNSMSDSSISAGSSYYYHSDVDDTYEYDEDSKIKKEISQDQNTISGQKIDKKYDSTLNKVNTKEANTSAAKQLRIHKKKKKIRETKIEPEKKYKCRKCARRYKYKESLYNHQKYECYVTPQFICKFCDKQFKQKGSMNIHLAAVHRLPILNQKKQKILKSKQKHIGYRHQKASINTYQAKHICDICHKAYSTLDSLYQHNSLIHAAVKPQFICHDCGYKTSLKCHLSRHVSSRHLKNSKISEARHNCDECSLNYGSLGALQQHKRLKHAAFKPEFICDLCGYKTDIKYTLSKHISSCRLKNSKTSRARYNCDKCNLSYNSLRTLREHKRIKHAAVKPQFICDDCGYKTDRKSNFSKHISSRHSKNSKK